MGRSQAKGDTEGSGGGQAKDRRALALRRDDLPRAAPAGAGYDFAVGRRFASAVVAILTTVACAAPLPPVVPGARLVDGSGAAIDARDLVRRAPLTAFVFFSAHCPCVDAHDARLIALSEAYRRRGVQFVMVDSEVTASPSADAAQARRRGYPFPIVVDAGARLAAALDAHSAAYAVVADAGGHVHYRGGIDSDRIRLHDDAAFYLRDAIDDLLAGRAPRVPEGKALGCALTE
jgi:hypothetical protein